MEQVEVVLISGRTTDQGVSLALGKTSEKYLRSVAVVELSAADADALSLSDGDTVEVSSPVGSVVVRCRRSGGLSPGVAFFPYGPWVNRVIAAGTGGTGMPLLRGGRVTVRPARGGRVPSIAELVEALRGGG